MKNVKKVSPISVVALSLASIVVLLASIGTASARGTKTEPLSVVEFVDLERYQGLWYEIARNPTLFEAGCVGATAEYAIRENGTVSVVNSCYVRSFEGRQRVVEGSAVVADPNTNAKLTVSFAPWPIRAETPEAGAPVPYDVGNYWIINLDPEYRYAVVGEASRTYLWILSRTPTLDETLMGSLLEQIEAAGYDTSKLYFTPQMPE